MVKNMGTRVELPGYLTGFTNCVTLGKLLNLKSSVFLPVKMGMIIVSTSLGYKKRV